MAKDAGLALRIIRLNVSEENTLNDRRDALGSDAVHLAVSRTQPLGKIFGALAGVTGNTTKSDIVASDDGGIVDDMFPRWSGSSTRRRNAEFDTTVDTVTISSRHLSFKPIWDVPSIHSRTLRR
jgi:hypothetical protein